MWSSIYLLWFKSVPQRASEEQSTAEMERPKGRREGETERSVKPEADVEQKNLASGVRSATGTSRHLCDISAQLSGITLEVGRPKTEDRSWGDNLPTDNPITNN